MSFKDGFRNGTRFMIRNLRADVIDSGILTGIREGDRVLISRVSLCPNDTNLPFYVKHIKFPLKLSYALTINKSQGNFIFIFSLVMASFMLHFHLLSHFKQ